MKLHIELKLSKIESWALQDYFRGKQQNMTQLKGAAPDQDYILTEFYYGKFLKDALRIETAISRTPKRVKLPVSVARILWKNWQQEFINQDLQRVLDGIDKELGNAGLKPVSF
jgi:hypothetical protein